MRKILSILLAVILTTSMFVIPTSANDKTVSLDEIFDDQIGSLDWFHTLSVSYMEFRMSRDLYKKYMPEDFDEEANDYAYYIDGDIYEAHLNELFVVTTADLYSLRSDDVYNEEDHTYKVEMIGGFGGVLAPREYIGFKENEDGTYYAYFATIIREDLPESEYDNVSDLDWPEKYEYNGKIYENGPDGYVYTGGLANNGRRYTVEYNETTGLVRFVSSYDYTESDLPDTFDSKNVKGVVFVEKHYKTGIEIVNANEQFEPFTTISITSIKPIEYGEENYTYTATATFLADKADAFKYYNIYSNAIAKPKDNVIISFEIPEGYENPVIYREDGRYDYKKLDATIDKSNNTISISVQTLGKFIICNSTQVAPPVDDNPPAPPSVEEIMKEKLGEAFEGAMADYEISAPEGYLAGENITITVTVKNIAAENGIHVAAFELYYDNEKLMLINDIDEEDENVLQCVKVLPKDWENLSKVANDYNSDNPEGTEVKPLNDGIIYVNAFTAKSTKSAAIKEDGALVFEFTFKVIDEAEGDIGIVIPHYRTECAYNGSQGEIIYNSNGDYAVLSKLEPIIIEAEEGAIEEDAVLNINAVAPEKLEEIFPLIEDLPSAIVFDIYIEKNDERIQPNGELKISILAPAGSENTNLKVYHIADDGTITDMNAVYENGYYTFKTTHLSYYMLANPNELYVRGDVNGKDGIEKYDYILVKRAVMGTIQLSEKQALAADVNGKDGVEKYDYILIKRHVMGTFTIG